MPQSMSARVFLIFLALYALLGMHFFYAQSGWFRVISAI